jgi:hypothetical protein
MQEAGRGQDVALSLHADGARLEGIAKQALRRLGREPPVLTPGIAPESATDVADPVRGRQHDAAGFQDALQME